MCQPKYWNKVYVGEVLEDRQKSVILIEAERSDFETLTVQLELDGNDNLGNIAAKVKKAINTLEGYRNCDCTAKMGSCIKHLSEINIVENLGAKSEVTIGGRG
jgi:hypothetical protein